MEFHLELEKFSEPLHNLWIEKRAKELLSLNWNDSLKKKKHIVTRDRDVRKKREISRIFEPFPRFHMFVSLSMNFADKKMKYWQCSMHIRKLKNTERKKNSLKINYGYSLKNCVLMTSFILFFCKRGPLGPPIRIEKKMFLKE